MQIFAARQFKATSWAAQICQSNNMEGFTQVRLPVGPSTRSRLQSTLRIRFGRGTQKYTDIPDIAAREGALGRSCRSTDFCIRLEARKEHLLTRRYSGLVSPVCLCIPVRYSA